MTLIDWQIARVPQVGMDNDNGYLIRTRMQHIIVILITFVVMKIPIISISIVILMLIILVIVIVILTLVIQTMI